MAFVAGYFAGVLSMFIGLLLIGRSQSKRVRRAVDQAVSDYALAQYQAAPGPAQGSTGDIWHDVSVN